MIIISQDKKKLFNLEQIRKIDAETSMIMVDDVSVLGEYSTEEKAIKVLDMIEKQYLDYCCNYHSQSGVFHMPQDCEV